MFITKQCSNIKYNFEKQSQHCSTILIYILSSSFYEYAYNCYILISEWMYNLNPAFSNILLWAISSIHKIERMKELTVSTKILWLMHYQTHLILYPSIYLSIPLSIHLSNFGFDAFQSKLKILWPGIQYLFMVLLLLKWNFHIMKYTYFTCTIWWILTNECIIATQTPSRCRALPFHLL